MSTLIKKDLVIKANTLPAVYSLTDSGRDLALKLMDKSTFSISSSDNLTASEKQPLANSDANYNSFENKNLHKSNLLGLSKQNNDKNVLSSVLTEQPKMKNHKDVIITLDNSCSEYDDCNLAMDDIIIIQENYETDLKTFERTNISLSSVKEGVNDFKQSIKPDVMLTLPAGTYEIILLVDTCETSHA